VDFDISMLNIAHVDLEVAYCICDCFVLSNAKVIRYLLRFYFLAFMQASTSMLEAKGEGIMSWFEDDNFILDDDLAPDFEV
jgi:hypothetical protein